MEDAPIKKESPTVKALKLLLKIAVTVFCFWYISRKIDFNQAKDALLKSEWLFMLLAIAAFMFGKLLSSFRLNIYFKNINIRLTQWQNIKLYWLGMYYNLFLPGAISGDAYKVILLNKKYNTSYKKTTTAVLLDRFSGLLALGLIMSAYGVIVLDKKFFYTILIIGSVLAVVVLYLVVRFILKDFLPGFWPTFLWGIAVQAFMVICVYCILMALHLPLHNSEWIFIFLIASVISVIPISLGGGLGTRELVFVEGAKYFSLDPHIAIVISLLFYLSNLLASVWGFYFIFNDPLKNDEDYSVVNKGIGYRIMKISLLKRIILNKGALWLCYLKLIPILKKLNKDSVVIDCGANTGDITNQFAKTGATVYAFEPDPIAFKILSERFNNNPHVTCINKGVWDKDAEVTLYSHIDQVNDEIPFTVGSSIIKEKKNVSGTKGITIEVINLLTFIKSLKRRINVIKMDVEGAETEILSKIIEDNGYHFFDNMYVETHEGKIPGQKEILNLLKNKMNNKEIKNIKLNWL